MLAALPAPAAVFNPETFTLGNGLQVVVLPNHRAPVVTHMVWYKVGAADEPPGLSGVAHLLEHLMFKGTESVPEGEFSRIVARIGGRENAFTAHDYTGYFQTIAKDRLARVMALETDRMSNLELTEDQIATERLVVLEERRQRTDNEPAAVLGEYVSAGLYLNHPYRRPIIGWAHEIAELDREAVLDFYRRWYAPNNAVLIVAGDITADELKPLAEATYGTIPPADVPRRLELAEPPQGAARRVVLHDAKVHQPIWLRSHLAPSYLDGATEHAYPLQVLSYILGGNATSRLYRQLVVADKKAVAAWSHYSATSRGPAEFTVGASPAAGVSVETLEASVEGVLSALLQDGVTADEVDRAKRRMLADAVYVRDSLSAGAQILGEALAMGRTVDDVEAWPERIRQVTPDQVRAAAEAVLRVERSVTASLLPEAETTAEAGR